MDDLDLKTYVPSSEVVELLKDLPILLLVGPTGSGKDTLCKELLKTGRFQSIVTHTTRPPRQNHGVLEVDGQDYHFIDLEMAKKMLEHKDFIEAAIIHGNLYGTSALEFDRAKQQSKIGVTDLDVQGVRSYRKLSSKVIAVFLLPPSFEIMLKRLSNRYGHSHDDQEIKIRLKTALDELYELVSVDYYYGVINDDLGQTVEIVQGLVETNVYDQKQNQQANDLANQLIGDIQKYLAN